jgi:hypothetical protein
MGLNTTVVFALKYTTENQKAIFLRHFILLRVSPNKFRTSPGDVSAMVLCAGLQHPPAIQVLHFKFICFQLNPAGAGSLPMLIYPHRENTGREEWILLLWKTCSSRREEWGFYYAILAPEGIIVELKFCSFFSIFLIQNKRL